MQKEQDKYLCNSNRLETSQKTIRVDTDASSLCAIIQIWVGYVHSTLEMERTQCLHMHEMHDDWN
jgi:hypothetical protein